MKLGKKVKKYIIKIYLIAIFQVLSHIFVYPFHRSYQYLESSITPPFLYHFIHYDKDEISSATGIRRRLKGILRSIYSNVIYSVCRLII